MEKRNIAIAIFFFFTLISCSSQQKATTLAPEQVTQALQNQTYQFLATYMQPTGGRQRNITGSYTLNVSKTQIVSDLPYFGKAYNVQPGSTDGGIKFQSNDFEYSSAAGKKGSQEIRIKTKDVQDTHEIFLTIFENGAASLRVSSVNRQSISYTGEIRALPENK